MISFSMDRYWAKTKETASIEVLNHKFAPNSKSAWDRKKRIETSHPIVEYSFLNYLHYVLYSPFYLAGPIITFNDFLHQVF